MRIAIEQRLKNGFLVEAVEKAGGQKALAEYLGIHYTTVNMWLNFRNFPILSSRVPRSVERNERLDKLFVELIGRGLAEIFPDEIRTEDFARLEKRKQLILDLTPEQLRAAGALPELPPAPDEAVNHRELGELISEKLDQLKPREAQVLRMRFGLGGYSPMTMDEVGRHFGFTIERVRQIEAKALRRLRHPTMTRDLKSFVGV